MGSKCNQVPSQTGWYRLPAHFRAMVSHRPHSILLETSRFDSLNCCSYLFLEPKRTIATSRLEEIPDLFCQIDAALNEECYVAGFLAYEAGYHFTDISMKDAASTEPLAWFGVYPRPCIFDHRTGAVLGVRAMPGNDAMAMPDRASAPATLALNISEAQYLVKIHQIHELIAQGETYQVNFTDQISFPVNSPAALYATLADQQAVSYGAYLNLEDRQILCFSPELFFKIQDETITTRPMKGTMPRGLDAQEDEAQAQRLRHDEKNRAEHVMIVDLLRNDLGRLCQPGSVEVSNPYSIERYHTLHQMTSTVAGRLRSKATYHEIFRSLFPCGSITGAPKIRTMQIIRALEQSSRGVYSGAIGFIAPNALATFNVAIRTLLIQNGAARMGVGGGIVADSVAQDEYRECLLKASFLNRRLEDFQLLETLRWDHHYPLLDYHLDRLQSSASYFGFRFDREKLRRQLRQQSAEFEAAKVYRVRVTLDASGQATLQSGELDMRAVRGAIRLATERTRSDDVLRRHKTTAREPYDRLHAQALAEGFGDVLFMNEKDEVTEGAINNLFVLKGGLWFTPPLKCGVLPGVFRRHLLETRPNTQEKILRIEDLVTADGLYLSNALRGLRRVQLQTEGVPPERSC